MTTLLLTHPACLLHDNGDGHPESPERLRAILAELDKPDFKTLQRRQAPKVTLDQIARVHDHDYIRRIMDLVPDSGTAVLDHETTLNRHSGEAALHAAGAVIAAVDEVCGAVARNAGQPRPITAAFCAVRPPGHHASVPPASGFCLFNSIAIGAAHAIATHGAQRVAIVDFDVHHGNGTQAWAQTSDQVLFISSHQYPLWPGSGLPDETGPKKNIMNFPLPPGSDGEFFRQVMSEKALPALRAYKPDLLMISAGFDAHRDDPLANIGLTEADYAWITAELVAIARAAGCGIVSTLEGGYNVAALASSVAAHVKALMAA